LPVDPLVKSMKAWRSVSNGFELMVGSGSSAEVASSSASGTTEVLSRSDVVGDPEGKKIRIRLFSSSG
jgi:hypothetical protein